MSAAEKLKARLYPVMDVERLTLREATAIVAVVEAADKTAASLHLEAHVGDVFRLSAALTALDEQLQEA